MADRRQLRAVAPGEKPPAKPPKRLSIAEAAEGGSHRDLLAAMRERIAKTVQDPNCPPRDLAALTRRLQEIAREIEALDARAAEEAAENRVAPDEAWDPQAL
jgi:hypothetical protein